ncbi:hypothetical protein IMAU20120_03134 [Lactiplantibacillus plantarum]|nr:hypothetical protein [Lactiplantibacillus plantarum]MCG0814175.1 hypothetical protein [Lactiplantibacillus plantarum]MCG0879547.1 hypothetical protein [Lactiplantibacillus plantarum]MCG0952067.1 hypothetical protein [Lactiplantibacillus plantarum]
MDNKDIELIQQMENKYDTFMPALTNLIDSVEKFNSIYNNYIEWQITSLIRTSPESFNGSLLMMYF